MGEAHALKFASVWAGWIVVLHCSCGYSTGLDCLDAAFQFNQHLREHPLA